MRIRFLLLLLALLVPTAAWSQSAVFVCVQLSSGIDRCAPVSATNPLPTSATITPSGTQNVNLTQILGAAPSLTNPLWVFPATGATFPISGTVTTTLPTTPTIAAGNGVVPSSSSETGAGATTTASSVLASNLVIKGSAGNLYSFEVSADTTLSAAAWWIMIFNATTLPANGTVTPAKCYAIPSGATSYSGGFNIPVNFPTGITIGVSTTGCFSLTASVHAFLTGDFK